MKRMVVHPVRNGGGWLLLRRLGAQARLILARFIQSMASSSDLVLISQKPATRSSVRLKGPRLTVLCRPEYLTRAPREVGCRPSPASMAPALTNSSLNLPIAVSNSVLGITPASLSLLAF